MSVLDEQTSRWFAWNTETHWDYTKTEDHVFAAYMPDGGKRIGDMTREELIHVIAKGYHDKDFLAAALCKLADAVPVDLIPLQLVSIIDRARKLEHIANESERMGEIMPVDSGKQANGHK